MDYLDPKKKRARKKRLMIGYGLMGVAIGIATLILFFIANGFYIDKSGQVIQNGLVYIDSRPGGAEIFVNGDKQGTKTDARLVIPAGVYNFELNKSGYRSWQRSIRLEGGSLRRLTYAKLIPEQLETNPVLDLRSTPTAVSQSINKRWLVLSYADSPLVLSIIDLEQQTLVPVSLEIPENLVAEGLNGRLEVIEWAENNRHFLAKYTTDTQVSYLLVNRENIAETRNLNTTFADRTLEIELRDRKSDEYFVYDPASLSLYTADLRNGVSQTAFAAGLLDYKTFGTDWLLYITTSGEEGLVNARFKRGSKDILIKQMKTSEEYLLQLAKLGNAPVMGISSVIENRALIYNDPEDYLNKNPGINMPIATTVLRVNSPIDLRISSDSSSIVAYGPENFASHEFEDDRTYNFKIVVPFDDEQKISWIDGQHFSFSSEGQQYMIDFDGSNRYDLVDSVSSLGSVFSEDINLMFSFSPAIPANGNTPAIPARVNLTHLLLQADR